MQEIKKFMDSVTALAGAVPKIAADLDGIRLMLDALGSRLDAPKSTTAPTVPTAPAPAAPIVSAASAPTDAEKARREFLKKELRARGQSFPASTRTATLEDMYAKTAAANADPFAETSAPSGADPFAETATAADPFADVKPAVAADPFADVKPAVLDFAEPRLADAPLVVAVVTKEEVRAALVAASGVKGKDAVFALMRAHGGSDKLSDINPSAYAAVLAACKAA